MIILGISAFYHDSAACLVINGNIIAAAQEERFSRKKNDSTFPNKAIKYCLDEAKILPKDIDSVVFYEKPFLKFERLLETYIAFAPRGFRSFAMSMPLWIKDKLFQKNTLTNLLKRHFGTSIDWYSKLLFSEHHLSHAASAFYPSNFERAAILTLDGVGEWTTTSFAVGNKNKIKIIKEIKFPHSLGLLYSSFTYYIGFKVNSGEYKVMGLAPYGSPKYAELIKQKLIYIADDGSFELDMSFFDYGTGLTMVNKKFCNLFGGPPRKPETPITQKEMDLAASIQNVTEEILVRLAKNIRKETGEENLCLSGGVALNCVANSKIITEKIFKNVWVQPASGDSGGALGSALAVWYMHFSNNRTIRRSQNFMNYSFLGPSYSNERIKKDLSSADAIFHQVNKKDLISKVAYLLSKGKAIGWMQGRLEFGPRALGARSILADPRNPKAQKELNLKIKFRESFRPFAPSILKEHLSEWFDINIESPYMLFTAYVKKNKRIKIKDKQKNILGLKKLNYVRSSIPAVTHVDYSSRIQTVTNDSNKMYYELIKQFYELTGCPILVNTSFNIRGEPIVCDPKDAFNCFMGTKLDILAIGDFILFKEDQKVKSIHDYQDKYELD